MRQVAPVGCHHYIFCFPEFTFYTCNQYIRSVLVHINEWASGAFFGCDLWLKCVFIQIWHSSLYEFERDWLKFLYMTIKMYIFYYMIYHQDIDSDSWLISTVAHSSFMYNWDIQLYSLIGLHFPMSPNYTPVRKTVELCRGNVRVF